MAQLLQFGVLTMPKLRSMAPEKPAASVKRLRVHTDCCKVSRVEISVHVARGVLQVACAECGEGCAEFAIAEAYNDAELERQAAKLAAEFK